MKCEEQALEVDWLKSGRIPQSRLHAAREQTETLFTRCRKPLKNPSPNCQRHYSSNRCPTPSTSIHPARIDESKIRDVQQDGDHWRSYRAIFTRDGYFRPKIFDFVRGRWYCHHLIDGCIRVVTYVSQGIVSGKMVCRSGYNAMQAESKIMRLQLLSLYQQHCERVAITLCETYTYFRNMF